MPLEILENPKRTDHDKEYKDAHLINELNRLYDNTRLQQVNIYNYRPVYTFWYLGGTNGTTAV